MPQGQHGKRGRLCRGTRLCCRPASLENNGGERHAHSGDILRVTFLLGAITAVFLVLKRKPSSAGVVKRQPDMKAPFEFGRDEILLGVTRLIVEWRRKGEAIASSGDPRNQSSTQDEDELPYAEMLGKNALSAAASGLTENGFVGLYTTGTEDEQQETIKAGPSR